jgi:hypothetical protein
MLGCLIWNVCSIKTWVKGFFMKNLAKLVGNLNRAHNAPHQRCAVPLLITALTAVIVFTMAGCGGGGSKLSGTWEREGPSSDVTGMFSQPYGSSSGYCTIVFKGKNFLLTEYPCFGETGDAGWPTQGWKGFASFGDSKNIDNETNDLVLLQSKDSWMGQGRQEHLYRRETRGKYSISEDKKIELVFSKSGNIYVHSFSRTENTLTIGGLRFKKKK